MPGGQGVTLFKGDGTEIGLTALFAALAKESGGNLASLAASLSGAAAPTIDSYGNAPINAATGARTQIIATPGTNKQIWIYGITILCDTADVTVTLESATTALSGAMPQADNGGYSVSPSGNFAMPSLKCATNEAFNITMGTGVGDGWVSYAIVDVS